MKGFDVFMTKLRNKYMNYYFETKLFKSKNISWVSLIGRAIIILFYGKVIDDKDKYIYAISLYLWQFLFRTFANYMIVENIIS